MEGLIPLVYKAIVQYRNGGAAWLGDTQTAAYMRLPGDSGRYAAADIQLFRQDYGGFTACSPPSSAAERAVTTATGQHHLINSCRAVK